MSDDFRIEVTPYHQELAARLTLATIEHNSDRFEAGLAEVLAAGEKAALAVLTVQSRNLAAAVVVLHGADDARNLFQRTIFDAQTGD